jgi:hypothetical protein
MIRLNAICSQRSWALTGRQRNHRQARKGDVLMDAYANEAPYCSSNQVDPSRVDIFVVPVMSTRPPDADRTLCKDGKVVSALLFADYDARVPVR